MEYFPLVQRFESALWVSLVCHGQASRYFDSALGWDYGVNRYRYEEHRHQIYIPDSQRLGNLIASLPFEERYETYRSRCEMACRKVMAAAGMAMSQFDPGGEKRESFEALAILFEASLEAMPFLPSLVLMQNELEQDLREALAADLGLDPTSDQFGAFWQRALVPREQANFVPESRGVLRMADEYHVAGLPLGLAAPDLPPEWRQRIDAHVAEFGWLGTFTYLNEPFSATEVLARVQHAAASPADELKETLERDREAVKVADEARAELTTERAQSLLDVARYFMYLRFERVDVHFRAEAMTRPIQQRLAELAGFSRGEMVMLTFDELRNWALGGAPLPEAGEITLRVENGVDYEVLDGVHSWSAAEPVQRTIDADARADARRGLPGSTACMGEARGAVKYVSSVADMQRFEEGDVLLTPMTTPDLMYAIERASAIVTEEGGVLCHAAIISRELNKPCLTGCRSATKAFEDGDLVELKAEEGGGIVTLLADGNGRAQ